MKPNRRRLDAPLTLLAVAGTLALGVRTCVGPGRPETLQTNGGTFNAPETKQWPTQSGKRPEREPDAPGSLVRIELSSTSLVDNLRKVDRAVADARGAVRGLAILGCRRCPFGDQGVAHLVSRHSDVPYRELRLQRTSISHVGLGSLLDAGVAARLSSLALPDNRIGPDGATMLAAREDLGCLRALNLGRNHLLTIGAQQLAKARSLSGLQRLELEYNFIGARGALALSESTALTSLVDLGLAYNYVGDDGAAALGAATLAPQLTTLDVRSNEIGPAGLATLATSPALRPSTDVWFELNRVECTTTPAGSRAEIIWDAPAPTPQREYLLDSRDRFSRAKDETSDAVAPAPPGLPERIDFRQAWIWDFDLIAEFPTFMTPEPRPGNGKSIEFSYLDRARLSIGAQRILAPHEFEKHIVSRLARTEGADRTSRSLGTNAILIRQGSNETITLSRIQREGDAVLLVEFSYPKEDAAYFGPIAERVALSLQPDGTSSAM